MDKTEEKMQMAAEPLWPDPAHPVSVDAVLEDLLEFIHEHRQVGCPKALRAALLELCDLATRHPGEELLGLYARMFERDTVFAAFLFMRHLQRHGAAGRRRAG